MNGKTSNIWEWPEAEFLNTKMDQEQELIFESLISILDTVRGAEILEPGSGTALVSYHLALAGGRITLCDLSESAVKGANLRFSKDEPADIVRADIRSLPFKTNAFDLVWNSGVMEHFSSGQLIGALKEMARVTRRFVAVFIPFRDCLPYRIAKLVSEAEGTWKWGLERPRRSLQNDFERAGIDVIDEYELGAETNIPISYLNLLPEPIAEAFEQDYIKRGHFYRGVSLATIGVKRF